MPKGISEQNMEEEAWPEVAVQQLQIAFTIMAALAIDGWIRCYGACLQPEPPKFNTVYSFRQLTSVDDWSMQGEEFYVGLPLGKSYGNVQPQFGASITPQGDLWAGVGATYTRHFGRNQRNYVELAIMPGFYHQGDGVYLGDRPALLRSWIGFGRELKNGNALTFFIDHRSNGYSGDGPNPGIESIGFNYQVRH